MKIKILNLIIEFLALALEITQNFPFYRNPSFLKELRSSSRKLYLCPPQKQAKTQPAFSTAIFQNTFYTLALDTVQSPNSCDENVGRHYKNDVVTLRDVIMRRCNEVFFLRLTFPSQLYGNFRPSSYSDAATTL